MFKIGDKIVYPMHGAGIITEVQNKEVLGVKKDYYILKMPMGEMKISIPVDKINDMGIRFVAEEEIIHSLRDILKNSEVDFPSNWNKRYKENLEKLRTGDIKETAIVYKGLYELDCSKGLSMIEKKVLNTSRKMLISEIASGLNIKPSKAESMVNELIDLD